MCFRADRKHKMVAPASDWLRYFQLLWYCRTEYNETWREARSQRQLQSLCFSGRSESQDGCPGHWLAETFFTSPLKPLNGIQRNLTGSKILTSSAMFVFFQFIQKNKMVALTETISTSLTPLTGIQRNLTGSKSSTSTTKSVFLGPIGKQDCRHILWLAETCLLPLWNRWTEFNETWQEARSQHLLPCFSCRSETQVGRSDLWFTETFSTSLKPLNRIQRNLTGIKISTSSTKAVFSCR